MFQDRHGWTYKEGRGGRRSFPTLNSTGNRGDTTGPRTPLPTMRLSTPAERLYREQEIPIWVLLCPRRNPMKICVQRRHRIWLEPLNIHCKKRLDMTIETTLEMSLEGHRPQWLRHSAMLSIFCPYKDSITAKSKSDPAFIKGVPTYASLSLT